MLGITFEHDTISLDECQITLIRIPHIRLFIEIKITRWITFKCGNEIVTVDVH